MADTIEEFFERSHQVCKYFERRYQCITDLTQSNTLQIRLQDLLSNPIIERKLEQVKEETKGNVKRKR